MGVTPDSVTVAVPQFGDGPFPADLDHVNWSAVMFGSLWALAYGAWPWFLLLACVDVGLVVLNYYLIGSGLGGIHSVRIAASGVFALIGWVAYAALGLRADRLAWARQSDRLAGLKRFGLGRAGSIAGYLAGQRRGAQIGIALTTLGAVWTLLTVTPFRLAPALAGYACALVVLLVLWLYDRRRHGAIAWGRPGGGPS